MVCHDALCSLVGRAVALAAQHRLAAVLPASSDLEVICVYRLREYVERVLGRVAPPGHASADVSCA
jgi:hypothetical protein